MLRHLQPLWWIELTKHNVLPMDDRFPACANPDWLVVQGSCATAPLNSGPETGWKALP